MTKLLFLCVANSARSQMAEGIAKAVLPAKIEVMSAGSKPGNKVHPMAIEVMAEFGIDISSVQPKAISNLQDGFLSEDCLVVRLCAEEECPLIRGAKVLDWSLPDPASIEEIEQKSAFRLTLKTLKEKIDALNLEYFGGDVK